ncbi:alanine dehydrogenase [[Limnothrix rosea] IAM M-220]|uniref:alanine dehydrogenase n=1 Tax=[Limnothrix rosea] IAM M-220 TaxID=454133 RepID=UPI00096822AF|nr:alanine dehydrogenase [[Limnothrix rosea] IAM M-220]OKH14629.1 alanine dehydrogenase [[Limnothrix rosea] IAM M-220]
MRIGVPKEIKDQEFRVGLSPSSVQVLVQAGHEVFVENNAGFGSGFTDEDYQNVGAKLVFDAASAWEQELVIKVKEPLPCEYEFLYDGQLLFTYLHLAAQRQLTERLIESGVTAIAYETVMDEQGRLPLLAPMSMIAGRLAVQLGARYLEKQQGGKGVLLGGVPGVAAGRVMILGGGNVGTEAAKMAIGLGAEVQILDINVDRLGDLGTLFGSRVSLLYSTPANIQKYIEEANLVIGAVLIPGRRAPILVSRDLVKTMQRGSVIVDVAVDQGGCIETLHPTSHSQPSYVDEGVVHVGIPNMPGAVPWTATQALNNSTLPYVLQLANEGRGAIAKNKALFHGLNIDKKEIVHPSIQDVFSDLL